MMSSVHENRNFFRLSSPPLRSTFPHVRRSPFFVLAQVSCWVLLANSAEAGDDAYLNRVKPLLQARCYACHGALKQEGGLRLDTGRLAFQGGDSGPAFVSGNPMASGIIHRVTAVDASDRMPPEHEGEPLTQEEVDVLSQWISSGAAYPQVEQPEADPGDHWAFRSLSRPPVPKVEEIDWTKNPIDAFVAAKHHALGLAPQPEAPRVVLLRRLWLDLIGLPPPANDIAAVLADPSDDWFERAVERLFEDPRHGERWARHWMDIWRYSDWWGLGDQLRNSQKHIWHWRDWIVESLNQDTPYDEMVRLMLAADELHPSDLDQLRATGYLARNYFLFNRPQWMDETVEHVSKSFLGLTMNCVKCHDHKYDPFPQVDYYRLRAFFEPYHVRLELLPGELDLERNGLPRVFDAHPDDPTYVYIRGDEKQPDKSHGIQPGFPEFLSWEECHIQPVDLPLEAWQPERRSWVSEAYIDAARKKLHSAELAVEKKRQGIEEGSSSGETAMGETANSGPADVDAQHREASFELRTAEALLAVARAELTSVELRVQAWQAIWHEAADTIRNETRMAAVQAQREVDVAKAEHNLIVEEHKAQSATVQQQETATQAVQAAQQGLEKATSALTSPVPAEENVAPLVGATWSATRFLDSTKDDRAPEYLPRSTGRRSALADWITDTRNPLTARVAVNHLWTRHFGTPLVSTVFDFGRNGSPPTHPELLDWLACELIESGWSMKHLHRLMVQSATYRMSSTLHDAQASLAKDPDNAGLWRRLPIRLESQVVRDSLLSLAGTLDPTLGGPPVMPDQQADSKRRSLYFFHSNNERNLFLTTFDEARVTDCYRREQSIVPQQALAMTNSSLVLDVSEPIAAGIERYSTLVRAEDHGSSNSKPSDSDFIRAAFLFLLASEPSESELAASLRAMEAWRSLPEAGHGETAEKYSRTHLIWVLLNHNDFVVAM